MRTRPTHPAKPRRFDRYRGSVPLFNLILLAIFVLGACARINESLPAPRHPTPIPRLTYPSPAPTDTPRPAATIPRTAAPAETCWSHSGRLVKGVIDTELLDKPMTYTVYQPPCYAEKTALRYPVLYLLHGQDSHEDQWLRLGVPATADRLIAAGEMPPFIIVFPYDYSHQQPDDYGFEAVFLQLLIPRIDLTYRTLTDPAHRAVGGLSRGGAWALHLGLHHPEVFGVIGAHSPAIFYADYNSLPLIVNAIPPEKLPRISIDIGDGDGGLGSVETFTNFLNVHNIPHEWQEHIGFHEEKYWAAHVEEYLRWYAQTW